MKMHRGVSEANWGLNPIAVTIQKIATVEQERVPKRKCVLKLFIFLPSCIIAEKTQQNPIP